MAHKKRKVPELNSTSTADIAFIMLIFFLITSTMNVDSGITRILPPPLDPTMTPPEIRKRNLLEVRINSADMMLVKGKPADISELRDITKMFISNRNNSEEWSEKREVEIPLLGGTYMASRGIISLQNDRGTSYNMYLQVQNELAAAINELRNELSKEQFGVSFTDLIDQAKIEAIQKAIPVSISEAEPENIGGNN
ncbi:MAG: biopolymer transporter ExbD [Bacteroidales bacterium]|jgi:biopolymer transport protein ExbD|nr:biopolymer transporter ExbD [Bacteroidales bacterium]